MSIDSFIRKNRHFGFKPKNYFRSEGEEGVRNLARLCSALGYSDPMHFGQFDGACYGDLINFLEDNSGAVEALLDWIQENYESELEESDEDSVEEVNLDNEDDEEDFDEEDEDCEDDEDE